MIRPVPVLAGVLAAAAVLLVAREDPGPRGREPATATASARSGRATFVRVGCGSCHRLAAAGSTGPVGPDLDARLRFHTRRSLVRAIRDPPTGGVMPRDLAQRMTAQEMDSLVDFLLAQR